MKQVIFCDFDGTITQNDNIINIFRHFQPAGWEQIKDEILSQKISVRQGVGQLFSLLPTSQKEEVIAYSINHAEIRSGFADFISFCKEHDIRLLITSGGIDFFVYPILEKFGIPKEDIYCNGSDFSGDRIKITWPHSCDKHCQNDCGMCKTTIIRSFPQSQYHRIIIGDSITDLAGARLVDLAIARDFLLERCQQEGITHQPFETFYDVMDIFQLSKNGYK